MHHSIIDENAPKIPCIYGFCIIAAVALTVAWCSRALLYIITAMNALCSLLKTVGIFHFITAFLLFFSFITRSHTHMLPWKCSVTLVMATILCHFTAFPWLVSKIIIYYSFLSRYLSSSKNLTAFNCWVSTWSLPTKFYCASIRSGWKFLKC